MKGIVHKIFNDKTVMKDVEVVIQLPNGTLKFTELRVGELVQIVKGQKPKPTKKRKSDSKEPGRL